MDSTGPSRRYRGALTDPDRWTAFSHRPGDVFVCTPPKCGTTWTQTMVTMLLQGTADLPAAIADLSPWVDAGLEDDPASELETMVARLQAQTARRCLKTHTPADGIPLWPDGVYIAVYRHPVDAFLSLRRHVANTREVRDGHPMSGSDAQAFDAFVAGEFDPDACDDDSLAGMVAHYLSFARSGAVPNLMLLHYADMLRDHAGTVARLAAHVGVAPAPDLLQAVTAATRLDAMRADPTRYAPFATSDMWRDPAAFFDSARTRGWDDRLPAAARPLYRARLAALLPLEADRAWLEHGGRVPSGTPQEGGRHE